MPRPMLVYWLTLAQLCAASLPRVLIPPSTTFVNLAWGFSNDIPVTNYPGTSTTGRLAIIVDLDLMPQANVSAYKAEGHIVICYFSVGTVESWRPDYNASTEAAWSAISLGIDPTWNEAWIDISKLAQVQALMLPRFQRAAAKGCDGIEGDNVDCYAQGSVCQGRINNSANGVQIVYAMERTYCAWQIETAHSLGMAMDLKNALDVPPTSLLVDLGSEYDFAVNEQCHEYAECSFYQDFVKTKAVFNHEYLAPPWNPSGSGSTDTSCTTSQSQDIRSVWCIPDSSNSGLCASSGAGYGWNYCDASEIPLPAIEYNMTGSIAPTPPTTQAPSSWPTQRPATSSPTLHPSGHPTTRPSHTPSVSPTGRPSRSPSHLPTSRPSTLKPSHLPTVMPSYKPSVRPTFEPTRFPTHSPSSKPTNSPSRSSPSHSPTSARPTHSPIRKPTLSPTRPTPLPTHVPTHTPTHSVPTHSPTSARPSHSPTTSRPTPPTTFAPSKTPTSAKPSHSPTTLRPTSPTTLAPTSQTQSPSANLGS